MERKRKYLKGKIEAFIVGTHTIKTLLHKITTAW
jgi:hypothetical protein